MLMLVAERSRYTADLYSRHCIVRRRLFYVMPRALKCASACRYKFSLAYYLVFTLLAVYMVEIGLTKNLNKRSFSSSLAITRGSLFLYLITVCRYNVRVCVRTQAC